MDMTTQAAELMITRVFPAPVERLFAAFTDPRKVERWWGLPGSRVIACALDVRVGGRWSITSAMADGNEMTALGVYEVVEAPRFLRWSWSFLSPEGETPPSFVEVTFEPVAEGTRLRLVQRNLVPASAMPLFEQGWNYALGNIEAVLAAG